MIVVILVANVVVVIVVVVAARLIVVVFAEEVTIVAQCEFVTGHQLALAEGAPETLDVVDLALGAHHKVGTAETRAALVALGAKQPFVIQINSLINYC